ncbi:MAG: RNase adapter RapZ [Bacteroidales bacterium]|nr:RNase adapter RapZ [Bacteroidales bacterium]
MQFILTAYLRRKKTVIVNKLSKLFERLYAHQPDFIQELPRSGSDRVYYRIGYQGDSFIGSYNPHPAENRAFEVFARFFKKAGLNVPSVLMHDSEQNCMILQDLGDRSLFSLLQSSGLSEHVKNIYRQVVADLFDFQVAGSKGLDYKVCYPRDAFDRRSMMWDLNYFKYYFLRLSGTPFDEQLLENDFEILVEFLLKNNADYFLYRDFQSRNIMIHNDMPWYIDFQGGRKGPLQYDLASLLFDAKAALPTAFREELLNHYIEKASSTPSFDKAKFLKSFYGFVLIRILQALGTYGFRGYYEQKTHFLQSIPFAMKNLQWLEENTEIPIHIPALREVLHTIANNPELASFGFVPEKLTCTIYSFSYKKGIPYDRTGNGGGYVFDCRALPNPGRLDAYKTLTGKDSEVIEYLEKEHAVHSFIEHTTALVEQSIEEYKRRGFSHLQISYGCTGGQHRSVYSAEQLFTRLQDHEDVDFRIIHREQPQL